MQTGGFSRN